MAHQNIASVDAGFLRGQSNTPHQRDHYEKGESRAFDEAATCPHLATTHWTQWHRPPWYCWCLKNELNTLYLSLIFLYIRVLHTGLLEYFIWYLFCTLVFNITLEVRWTPMISNVVPLLLNIEVCTCPTSTYDRLLWIYILWGFTTFNYCLVKDLFGGDR